MRVELETKLYMKTKLRKVCSKIKIKIGFMVSEAPSKEKPKFATTFVEEKICRIKELKCAAQGTTSASF